MRIKENPYFSKKTLNELKKYLKMSDEEAGRLKKLIENRNRKKDFHDFLKGTEKIFHVTPFNAIAPNVIPSD